MPAYAAIHMICNFIYIDELKLLIPHMLFTCLYENDCKMDATKSFSNEPRQNTTHLGGHLVKDKYAKYCTYVLARSHLTMCY